MHIQFVIARGHATKMLKTAEKPLNGVVLGVEGCVVGRRCRRLRRGRITAQVLGAVNTATGGSES